MTITRLLSLKHLCLALLLALTTATATAQTLQHIRNATSRLEFAGKTFLIDPMLAPKGHYEGFAGTVRSHLRNPLVDLPFSTEEVLRGVDAIVVTHTHLDHWDSIAQQDISKTLPILVQNTHDAAIIRSQGFVNVYIIGVDSHPFAGITISNVRGQHGSDAMYKVPALAEGLGETIGIVFQAKGQKTVYIAGDTIWTDEVTRAITHYKPRIIILNTGNALIEGFDQSIIMGTADVARAAKEAPKATIVAVHMDAINHCVLTRSDLNTFVKQHQLTKRVRIPADGATLKF